MVMITGVLGENFKWFENAVNPCSSAQFNVSFTPTVDRQTDCNFPFSENMSVVMQSTCTKRHLYLYSVAEVGSSGDSHHGQQARSCPDVQDNDLLTASLHSGHSRPDALVVLLILGKRAQQPS